MSKPIKLSKTFQEFEFYDYYKENRSRSYIYRCLALHHIQKGKSYDQVSDIILYSRKTIMEWVRRFEEGGVDHLLSTKAGRGRKAMVSSDLSQEFNESVILLQESRSGGRVIGQDIVNLVQEKHGVQYSVSGIYKLLSRMGLSWVSGRSIHPKANPAAQEAFKKNFKQAVMDAIPKHVDLKDVEIWYEDETRVGQQGSISRTWFIKGQRPRLVKQQQFLNAYIFSAACPDKDKAVGFISPVCNKEAMQIHLDMISQSVEGNAVILLDGAGWHSAKALIIPKNITLLKLPPYSPELNSKENFWQSLKSKHLTNVVFSSVDNIMDICQKAWLDFVSIKGNVKRVCSRDWACLS